MVGCQQSLDWTTGLDYWTDQFYHKIHTCGLKTLVPELGSCMEVTTLAEHRLGFG